MVPAALQRSIAVSTDNAANITKVVTDTSMHHVRCFAHRTNLGAQKFHSNVGDPFSRVRAIAKFFHYSPRAENLLRVDK